MFKRVFSKHQVILFGGSKPIRCFTSNPRVQKSVEESSQEKLLKIAIIGVPNAGKSTFINRLANHRVCPTSSKVHTTRTASRTIVNYNDTQMIFFDTPGLVTNRELHKHNLESSFTSAYAHAIQHSNIIGVLHDVSNHWTRSELHPTVLKTLDRYKTFPSFLVLNKIDTLRSKRVLLDLVDKLTLSSLDGVRRKGAKEVEVDTKKLIGWANFNRVFMVSALTGNGMEGIMNFLNRKATTCPWEFTEGVHSDQSTETLIQDTVRARLLDFMPQEIPYTLECELEYLQKVRGVLYASVQVICPNVRIEKLVCGGADGKLHQITERVSSDLVEAFRMPISITITTTVRKNE
ncbi:GTP-binding protein Era [Sergentomyia squamirostris]